MHFLSSFSFSKFSWLGAWWIKSFSGLWYRSFRVERIVAIQTAEHRVTVVAYNRSKIYSQFSRRITVRGSCIDLVTVCPTKVVFLVSMVSIVNMVLLIPIWIRYSPYKRGFVTRKKSFNNYLPKCTYHLLYCPGGWMDVKAKDCLQQ